jgi:hypothetical protein
MSPHHLLNLIGFIVNAETVDDRLGRFILSDYFDILPIFLSFIAALSSA